MITKNPSQLRRKKVIPLCNCRCHAIIWPAVYGTNFDMWILLTLSTSNFERDGACWVLPVHTTFIPDLEADLGQISGSHWKLCFLGKLCFPVMFQIVCYILETTIDALNNLSVHLKEIIFYLCNCKRTYMVTEIFETMHDDILSQALLAHTRCSDLNTSLFPWS